MVRGKHRSRAPVALMAAAVILLTAGGIVAATSTADAHSGDRRGGNSAAAQHAFNGHKNSGGDRRGKWNGKKERGKKRHAQNRQAQKKPAQQNAAPQNAVAVEFPGREQAGGPARRDFVRIEQVRANVRQVEPGPDASTGTFTSPCGTNAEGHRNSDNFMVAPGKVNGAQHVHDYVGNRSANAFSTDESLHDAGTTCTNGDRSTYFWPVLRDTSKRGDDALVDGGGLDGNFGEILEPATVSLEFRGNPTSKVTPIPDDLTTIMGDAKAVTNGDDNALAAWTCTGFEDRTTTRYPLCPQGSQLIRILDFPSCWDGQNLDSENHRDHIAFPRRDGSCGRGTETIPQLRITLTYDQPENRNFALDSFPDQRHNPTTDHADFMAIMPEALLEQMADCINTGQTC